MPKVEVNLITGRTAQQGIALEEGKTSDAYRASTAHVQLNPIDAEALNLDADEPVQVATLHGSVTVNWKTAKNLDPGTAFFPYGPWANQVIGSNTQGTGMPLYKGLNASVEPAVGQQVLTLTELVQSLRGGQK